MRRIFAALSIAMIAFAMSAPQSTASCCCKSSCPMKRAVQMHCGNDACTLSPTAITATVADAILSPATNAIAMNAAPLFAAPPAIASLFAVSPDTPPPRS